MLTFAGFAGLVAGTLAAGAVEYSKTGAERDQQVAQLTSERAQLAAAPDAELDEHGCHTCPQRTLRSHSQSIYRKLGASSRNEAVTRAGELGLLEA
jgi:hypothetical protein